MNIYEDLSDIPFEDLLKNEPELLATKDAWDPGDSLTFANILFNTPHAAKKAAFQRWVGDSKGKIPTSEADNLQEWMKGITFGSAMCGISLYVPESECREMIESHNEAIENG